MKSKIYLLLIALLCTAATGRAATLLVKEYGVNNTYATIQAAINASVNNDTILVYDKPSGQLWVENITIDKNLWIANPIDTLRFKLQGNITIVPKSGMQLFMVGYNLVGGGSINFSTTGATATASNRATILLSDAIVTGTVDLQADWLDVRVVYSNITGQISLRHGIVAGNLMSGGLLITQESSVSNGNDQDSVIIIGNKGTWCSIDTRGGVLVSNNYFRFDTQTNSWNVLGPNHALGLFNHNSNINIKAVISNNYIQNFGSCSNSSSFALVPRFYSNTSIINNVIWTSNQCAGSNYGIHDPGGSSGTPFISHNLIVSSNTINISVNNELNYYNIGPGAFDTYGRAAAGNTNCINKGLYLGQYYDIDLTRNDLGTYGGPFSIDNFIGASTGKGRVFWIDVPHQLSNINQLININAGAASKF